jgi:RNA-directed DNA polymerase
MLNIQHLEHLEHLLDIPREQLIRVSDTTPAYVKELTAWDPTRPEKPRPVIAVSGELRAIQERLLSRLFRKKLKPAPCSYGGVKGKTIVANALAHRENDFLYLADISDFFRTISNTRVNRFLMNEQRCSPPVARLLTKLCTYEFHLALGLVTSPILADQILNNVDRAILGACTAVGMNYTRWVDDIAISAKFDLEDSGIPALISRIFNQHGFTINTAKDEYGRLADGTAITKIRITRGRPDVSVKYLHELERQLVDHASLSRGQAFQGPFLSAKQLKGKILYVCWINPARKKALLRQFVRINWFKLNVQARSRGLVGLRRMVTQRGVVPAGFADT